MRLLERLHQVECAMCHGEIPTERRGITVNVCSDACDADEQAARPF